MQQSAPPAPQPPAQAPVPPAPPTSPDGSGALDRTLVDPVSPFATTDTNTVMEALTPLDDILEPAKPPPLPKRPQSGPMVRRPTPTQIRSASSALAGVPSPSTPPASTAARASGPRPPPLALDPIDSNPPPQSAQPSSKENAASQASPKPSSIPPGPPLPNAAPGANTGPQSTPPPVLRPSSLKPPPPSSSKSSRPGSSRPGSKRPSGLPMFEGFDEGSVLDAFDALMADGPTGPPSHETDLTPVRELFGELAASHMRHVRDFMIDVKWGEATRDWLEICVPAVTSLFRAAERLGIAELATALEGFSGSLRDAITKGGARVIEGETKDTLLSAYEKLVEILPNAFALERDRNQREAVIVQSLLLSVPDVRKVTIDKLHAAGLTSLATLYDGKPDEIAVVTGISRELATRIVERFQAYRREIQNASPSDARAAEREKLSTLADTLKKHHDVYEEASKGWDADAKLRKRESFRAREETWLEISVLLARFGEVDRLAGIEKVPFGQRITQLQAFLEEAAENYRPSQP
jgi:hypothetical protein